MERSKNQGNRKPGDSLVEKPADGSARSAGGRAKKIESAPASPDTGRSAMKRKNTKPDAGTGGNGGKPGMIALKDIHTHPMFVDLLPIAEDLLEKMILDMRAHGFYGSEPIVLGKWPGQEEPVLIDGHVRIGASREAGVTKVPYVVVEFDSQMAALQHAINLQEVRRKSTDGAYYRLCEQYDTMIQWGGDRRSEEARSKMQGCNLNGASTSARRTAQLIGCHYRKVDKIRRIRRDGWPEIQEDVRNDKLTINKAYDMIRKRELGEEEQSTRKLTAGQVKMLKSVLSEEYFVALEAMGDDLGALLNAAVERFIGEPRETE